MPDKDGDQPTRELRVMLAGAQCVGIFADQIETISDWRIPTPLPDAPAGVLGIVCIRGRMLTVLSAAAILKDTSAGEGKIPAKVVSLIGDEQIALAVDQVEETIVIAPADLPVAGMASLIRGVITESDRDITVLNTNELFATAMRGRERRRRQF